MTEPGVILDANVYRSMPATQFGALVAQERRRGVARYAEPFALMELLAARATNYEDRVLTVAAYERWLAGSAVKEI